MSTVSGTLYNPTPSAGEHQFGQSAWFIPTASTTVAITVNCKDGNGNNAVVNNLFLYLHNVTQNFDIYAHNFGSGIYSATASSLGSSYYNGSNVFTPGFASTSNIYEVDVTVTFTGNPYLTGGGGGGGAGNMFTFNNGIWTSQAVESYQGGVWETAATLWVYVNGAWEQRA